ncbi:MAG: DUF4876 domain-containing protein [Caldithrix sp.]|nr:DUF4876 domain-containing protein [Caldithrix sp.]
MKTGIWGIVLFSIWLSVACQRTMPTQQDGQMEFTVVVKDASGIVQGDSMLAYSPVSHATVTLASNSYYTTENKPETFTAVTDADGQVCFKDLPMASYSVDVQKEWIYEDTETGMMDTVMLRGSKIVDLMPGSEMIDTVETIMETASDLVINEIYYCGPVNNAFYFYDQFVELYNPSKDTVYLDGKVLCRALSRQHPQMDTIDFMQALYIYQFPGEPLTGRNYPLLPGEFTVIAQDAFDHSQFIGSSIDLSTADWEFYNPYKGDYDSPPANVTNIAPDNSVDFMINLSHNGVILADGSEWYYGEYSQSGNYQYIHLPLHTIIDAVEYASSLESTKELTRRVDAGFAGVGMSKYSGKSTERRIPGFDTNNSTLDFIVIDHPTPGYQHE